ncbi:hypothetical protein [Candidatus Binatus sp.]|uniref:hypothetical protein n=1 Tax=Candidatus Binatus sp. TaxID=2811406 RepID=UPI003C8BEDDA
MTPIDKSNEPLDAILRWTMSERLGPATPECADAESLAAYSERSLPVPERDRLEIHFADCMRCRVLLADIARAGESAREAKASSDVPWYRKWRGAIPALAAVTAIVVFVSMSRPANAQSRALAAPRAEAMVPGAQAMIAQNEDKTNAMQTYGAADASSAPVAGSAAAPNAGYAMQAGVLATIPSSDRSVTWIAGKNGTIRRVDANGGSRSQQSGVSTDLDAGAAPSSSVCWVVGRSGTILRTTDGEHWSPVPAPSTEDLVAVSASSASDATVTTSSSKTFATFDGGATWHQQ